jgi:hypothetical protein
LGREHREGGGGAGRREHWRTCTVPDRADGACYVGAVALEGGVGWGGWVGARQQEAGQRGQGPGQQPRSGAVACTGLRPRAPPLPTPAPSTPHQAAGSQAGWRPPLPRPPPPLNTTALTCTAPTCHQQGGHAVTLLSPSSSLPLAPTPPSPPPPPPHLHVVVPMGARGVGRVHAAAHHRLGEVAVARVHAGVDDAEHHLRPAGPGVGGPGSRGAERAAPGFA